MMEFDWFTGTIDRARETDVFDNADLMSGAVWDEFADAVKRVGKEMLRPDIPGDPIARATAFRHLLVLLGTGINQVFLTSSPYRPALGMGGITRTDIFKWGLDCPDCIYRTTDIRGDLDYRITGQVVPHNYLGFQANRGMAVNTNLRLDEMAIAPDGSFELWMGPNERPGNWLRTNRDCNMLITRQFFGDWEHERLVPLSIELVAGQDIPNPIPDIDLPTPDRVARQIRALAKWLEANAKFWNDVESAGQEHFVNAFDPPSVKTAMGGAAENCNAWGHFNMAADEALIIEVEPVPCLYWSLHVGNFWWESLDYARYHTSLNHRQAQIDSDGLCRIVLSPVDPGVPNWLDTLGHLTGPLLFRWIVAQRPPNHASTKLVKASDVLAHLPADTPRITTGARHTIIENRLKHVMQRFQRI